MQRDHAKPKHAKEDGAAERGKLPPAGTLPKGVSFSSVHIHEHPIVLGDNPSCSSGPPVSLGWEAETSLKCSIDEYEAARRPERRRSIDEMRIPPKVRTEWLLADSVAPRQIHEAVQDLNEHKHRRRVSLGKSPLQDKADEVGESVRRRLHRAVGRKARSNDLYTQLISQLEVARDLRVTGDKRVSPLKVQA